METFILTFYARHISNGEITKKHSSLFRSIVSLSVVIKVMSYRIFIAFYEVHLTSQIKNESAQIDVEPYKVKREAKKVRKEVMRGRLIEKKKDRRPSNNISCEQITSFS